MSNKQLRNAIRLGHLIIAGILAVFAYSPLRLNDTFTAIVQMIVIPVLVASGIVLWQQPLVVKWLNRGRSQEQAKNA